MKLVITSDTHFGDPATKLVSADSSRATDTFERFAEAAGSDNDYLVLLGDIFDFSVASYAEAYRAAQKFFRLVKEHNIAPAVIYVPGNHDFDMWTTVQYQFRVMYQVRLGRPAQEFRYSQPGLIEARSKADYVGFSLPGMTDIIDPRLHPKPNRQLWLNQVVCRPDHTDHGDQSDGQLNFYIAYPNLYLATDDGSLVLSHGHYVEPFWQACEEWVRLMVGDDLGAADTLDNLVALNAPLCQLACSGIGQAGKLTTLIRDLQHRIKAGDYSALRKYLKRLAHGIEKQIRFTGWARPLELIDGPALEQAAGALVDHIESSGSTRGNAVFPSTDPDELARFGKYYQLSCDELAGLGDGVGGLHDRLDGSCDVLGGRGNELDGSDGEPGGSGFDVPRPERMILGHSHRPRAWGASRAVTIDVDGRHVSVYNTGGWLATDAGTSGSTSDVADGRTAELFILKDGALSSERV
jgi:3',5'-cyclic AMP phosphodiesterase CpdA